MKNIKLLIIVFIMSLSYSSCVNDETSIDENEFNVEKVYQKVINSENPKEEFDNYTDSEKAELWNHKYELFLSLSKLSNEQIIIINELKSIAVNSIKGDYYENELDEIQNRVINHFNEDQFFDLFFFLDNPSLKQNPEKKVCFWCTMYTVDSDCYYNGSSWVTDATFYDCRFWSCHEVASTGTAPC